MLTMVVALVLITMVGAFVVVNRSNNALTGSAVARQNAYNACLTGLHYAWSELELNQAWGANGFPDGVQTFSYPSGDPKLRVTVYGDSSAPDDPSVNYVEGELLATGETFRLTMVNNLQNRVLKDATFLGDVPGRCTRLSIVGSSGSVSRRMDSVLRKSPYVDSSAVSRDDMTIALDDPGGRQWRLRSKDPYINQVRSNTEIIGPSATAGQVNFRDPPRGGVAMASDDILLGGTSVQSSTSFLTQSQQSANGSFVVGAPEVEVPDLERDNLKFPENEVPIPGGAMTFRRLERHEWQSADVPLDLTVPPDGVPDDTVTRWTRRVSTHNAIEHAADLWVSRTADVTEDFQILSGPSDGYDAPTTSEGFQGIAGPQPADAELDDYPVLYEYDATHRMRANLVNGQITMSPGTQFNVSGDLHIEQEPGALQPDLKFGYDMQDDGSTDFTAMVNGSAAALDDPAANSAALVSTGNLYIDGVTSGFGSIFSDGQVSLRAKSGLRAEPDLAVAVHGSGIDMYAEEPPDEPVSNHSLEADWNVYQDALGTDGYSFSQFDNWFDMSVTSRRGIIGDDPATQSGLRTTPLDKSAAQFWAMLDAELDLGPAPNFGSAPFGSEWSGNLTLEEYTRLREYALSDRDATWIITPGPRFQEVLGRIDSTIMSYDQWAERVDMDLEAFMSEDVPLIPDVYFVGLVHAGNLGFSADTNGSSLLVEGALVSQGRITITNSPEVDFVYNRLYLDDVVRHFVGDLVKLDQVYFNIQ